MRVHPVCEGFLLHSLILTWREGGGKEEGRRGEKGKRGGGGGGGGGEAERKRVGHGEIEGDWEGENEKGKLQSLQSQISI